MTLAARTAGLPSDDNAALAGLLGDGRDSGQTAQSGAVAPLQAIPGLCEQRGEENPSNSRQGCKDFHAMLLLLPRPASSAGMSRPSGHPACDEPLRPVRS